MQKKPLNANTLLDKLHRGAVYACIGVTLYGTYILGMRYYHYYTVIRPEKQQAELKLLDEGAHDKAKELKY
ncbi:uncharacterized protein Dwil_GK16051 [Drosophila willistoni]|uniref:Cytochrome c oxidase assembly factor 3 n=1 Tax=Drosophila willistoni TaxID=7260 RepID=B4NQ12_DROWI|nr:uncharacterized protein LOC6653030 [Drosophila willistoni]EDW86237.1 uncharacterized protein Dwil_GK16051 [Drosophila willistoni]